MRDIPTDMCSSTATSYVKCCALRGKVYTNWGRGVKVALTCFGKVD